MKRNGNGKKPGLKRNGNGNHSCSNPLEESKARMYKGKLKFLTKTQLKMLQQEDDRIVKWFSQLKQHDCFSREWIMSCLTEIALQCMGKIPHACGDSYINTFIPKSAISSLKLMAEMQGFNVFKVDARLGVLTAYNGNGSQQKQLEDQRPKSIELKDDDEETTKQVAEILGKAGVFQSYLSDKGTSEIIDAEVVEVHST